MVDITCGNLQLVICMLLVVYMQVFKLTDMKTLRKKSCLLTGYYELLLKNLAPDEPDADQEAQTKKKKPAGSYSSNNICV